MTGQQGASILVTGIVQGVGFRPFVYGLAQRFKLAGWVRNTSAGVEIQVDGSTESITEFVRALRSELPELARIDSLDMHLEPAHDHTGFEILTSEAIQGAFQPISPDVSICPDCLRELFDPSDRRFHYPFINCTNCGPRFTIITDIPYDRPNTTMAGFEMCTDCAGEYSEPLDRRFHAQPIACPACGPHVWLESVDGKRIADGDQTFTYAQKLLLQGKILAIKGLGGFHLACDATNKEAVTALRERKLRVDKPFALMMPDMDTVELNCIVTAEERSVLESRQKPIVLLRRKPLTRIVEQVAPLQATLAVMLPYTPLHYLLFSKDFGTSLPPLVMTSGNLSEEPIASGNDEARERLGPLADGFLMHNREIQTRCDDSVLRLLSKSVIKDEGAYSVENGGKAAPISIYFLRRSRGYAPDPIPLPMTKELPSILAAGPELKNTFCLTRNKYAFMSHHIGDMENYETLRSFEDGITYFERLFRIEPKLIACDLHPNYLSSRYALQRALQNDLPLYRIQHHHAHIASCMADNHLDGSRPVIGLAFDGTGFGEDGAIWGGEVLVADYSGYQRPFHLEYFPLAGGDAAIKRPARTAFSLLWAHGIDWEEFLPPAQDLCYEDRQALRIQLERKLNTPLTSSLGRLFDAVAALAGVRQLVNYEAQAAIEFESAIDPAESTSYSFEMKEDTIGFDRMLSELLLDLRASTPIPRISARFHNGLADLVLSVCQLLRTRTGIDEVALSGGVWQNMALLEKSLIRLQTNGFKVYLHNQVPTNDGGLSLGQAMVAAARHAV